VLLVVSGVTELRFRAALVQNKFLKRGDQLRKSFLVAGTAALALASTGVAIAQDQPTTSVSVTLSPNKAGTTKKPRATKIALKVTNNATSQTASQLKFVGPKQITFSTKGFKTCSVNTLGNQGPTACPKGSQVGPTKIANALAGVSGTAPAKAAFEVTPFATGSKSIGFFLELNKGGIYVTGVATGTISGHTLTVKIPENPAQQLPKGTYNGLVDLTAELWVKGGKSVAKLSGCPSSKKLTFKSTVTFVPTPKPAAVPSHTATTTVSCRK